MNDSGVSGAVLEHFFAHFKGVVCGVGFNHRKNRGELLQSERIFLRVCAGKLNAEYLCLLGNGNACFFSDLPGVLTNNPRLYSHFLNVDNNVLYLLYFVGLSKVAAVVFHEADSLVVNLGINDRSLFGGADHTVVKGFGKNQIVNSLFDIGCFIDVAGCVAGTYAESWLTCGISGFYHSGTAGGEDSCNVGVVHKETRSFNGRVFYPLYAVLGSARFNGSFKKYLGSFLGALLSRGVEAENNGVSCLCTYDSLEHCCGSRVRGRSYAAYDTNRLCDLHIAFVNVVFDNADGFLVLDRVPDVFCGEDVFGDLVLEDTSACFLNSHFGKLHLSGKSCQSHCLCDLVYLLLIESHILFESLFRIAHESVDHLGSFDLCFLGNGSVLFLCHV